MRKTAYRGEGGNKESTGKEGERERGSQGRVVNKAVYSNEEE